MRGEKVIELGTPFRYPSGKGEYLDASTVKVRAPGLDQFGVHNKMQSLVMGAAFEMARKAAVMRGAAQVRAESESEDQSDEAAPEPAGSEIMDQMSIGLGADSYPAFVEYVKKTLTNSKLATIGDGNVRITDEAWEGIEESGGLEAVLEILGAFAGFFVSALGSKKPSGKKPSTTSSLPTTAASAPNGRRPPRLPN